MKKISIICFVAILFCHNVKQSYDQVNIGTAGNDNQITTMATKQRSLKDSKKNGTTNVDKEKERTNLDSLKTNISFYLSFQEKRNIKMTGLFGLIFSARRSFNSIRADGLSNNTFVEIKAQLKQASHKRVRKRRNPISYSIPVINVCASPLLSCKERCMNERDAGGTQQLRCSCDPYCDYFMDCCADYVQYCMVQRSSNTTKTAMKVPDEQWTCRSGIWMIASCPQSWTNQHINQSCISMRSMTADNYKDVLPVITANNKTYANRFCAQCHGQTLQTIVELYELEFQCLVAPPSQATKEKKMKFLFEFCNRDPIPKIKEEVPKRHCFESKVKCSNLALPKEIQNKCTNGHYGLVYMPLTKIMYKNVYCGLCNDVLTMECGPISSPLVINYRTVFQLGSARPFSIVMDIGGKSSKASERSAASCPKGKVYDVYLEVCRLGKNVVPLQSSLKIYKVTLWMKIIDNYKPYPFLLDAFKFRKYFASAFGLAFTRLTSIRLDLVDRYQYMYKVEFDMDITNYTKNHIKQDNNITLLFKTFKTFELQIGDVHFIVMKVTTKPLTCVQTDTYSTHEYQVIPGQMGYVYINQTGEVLGARDYFSTNQTTIKGQQVPVGQIVVCRQMPSVNCSGMYIFLQKHEYTIFPNRSVLHKASGHLHEHGTYTWKNGTIMICTNFTATYQQVSQSVTDNNHKALTILTYIGFCISVLCLLFVLVTYSIFADLRTIPGINLMNLCSALLVAQLLWLVGSGLTFTRLGCMVIAIVLHYSFLASFWWMSIIAFGTWKAFSGKASTRRNDRRQKQKRIVRTMAMGWLPLVMYVSICVALDRSETVAIGYGGEKGCWINNPRANLFFFAIPLGLSILWNAVFFVLIIKEIKKAIDQSQMVARQNQARQDSAVYARIAVLMGFTWVFGFVAPFTSYYLMYPFVILNTLQGLYIAAAFGLTRRVRSLYKNIRSKKSKMTSSNTNKTRETML